MTTVLLVVGSLVALSAAVLLCGALFVGAVRLVELGVYRLESRGERRAWDWQKNKLRAAAWWFSEDTPTRELLADLAEMNEWQARDKWRKARSAAGDSEAERASMNAVLFWPLRPRCSTVSNVLYFLALRPTTEPQ